MEHRSRQISACPLKKAIHSPSEILSYFGMAFGSDHQTRGSLNQGMPPDVVQQHLEPRSPGSESSVLMLANYCDTISAYRIGRSCPYHTKPIASNRSNWGCSEPSIATTAQTRVRYLVDSGPYVAKQTVACGCAELTKAKTRKTMRGLMVAGTTETLQESSRLKRW